MTPQIRRRTKAREIAIQLLYEADLCGATLDELEARVSEMADRDAEVEAFAGRLFRGALTHRAETDSVLREVASNWDIPRMATVDRNILRMAVYELKHCADIPPKVSINEAIELGKRFSTAKSGSFINGILDGVRIDMERASAGPVAEA